MWSYYIASHYQTLMIGAEPMATDVALSVCLLITISSPTKTAEPIVVSLGAQYWDQRACMCVRECISKIRCPNFTKFYVHIAQSSSGDILMDEIRYVLPVLWTTSFLCSRPGNGDAATDSIGNIWKHTYLGPRNCGASWLLIIVRYINTLTYLYSTWPIRRQHRWRCAMSMQLSCGRLTVRWWTRDMTWSWFWTTRRVRRLRRSSTWAAVHSPISIAFTSSASTSDVTTRVVLNTPLTRDTFPPKYLRFFSLQVYSAEMSFTCQEQSVNFFIFKNDKSQIRKIFGLWINNNAILELNYN